MNCIDRIAEAIAVLSGAQSAPDPQEHARPDPGVVGVKLAIVVGHNARAKGAFSRLLGSEFDFNSGVAQMIYDAAEGTGVTIRVFNRDPLGAFGREIDEVSKRINDWSPDFVVSLHFNGFRTDAANGTETLWTGNEGSREFAETVQACMLDCFGLNNRGLKAVGRKDRGGRILWNVKAPAVLLEPGFGTNPRDSRALKRHWPVFAEDLVWLVRKLKG